MDSTDLQAFTLTLELALTTSLILLPLGAMISYGLLKLSANTRAIAQAVIALPLILPPTVLGFYLLVLFSPNHPLGELWLSVFGSTLAFSYSAIVIGSVIFSLPFAVHPIYNALAKIPRDQLDAARSFGLSRRRVFFNLQIPAARAGFVSASVLSFAHTVGEFGVVLMVGGSIPGKTKVLSVALLEHVELMQYQQAHWIAIILVIASTSLLSLLFIAENRRAS